MGLKKIKECIYEVEKTGAMNVAGRVYASPALLDVMKNEKTLQQVRNVATLPGIVSFSSALADAHQGYGFPIGGVAGFDMKKGVISPGGVGYDINCSVRLLTTNITKRQLLKKHHELTKALYAKIPSGVGRGGPFPLSKKELVKILNGGAQYLVEKGYGKKEDVTHTEEGGCMKEADASKVSERALRRGIGQLGTLGSGNHFLEVQYVENIFNKNVAERFGLKKDQIVVMIHCGSRGLGHQVASDYIQKMEDAYGTENLADRELVYAPLTSKLGKDYYKAMAAAANFAFANKQLITHWVREVFSSFFLSAKVDVLYDVCHNIAKIEEHILDGKKKTVCVHRKGATRSFGPKRKEIPRAYRAVGQPVLIPGSMGTASYVLVGTKKAETLTFGSTVHGAGRMKSRSAATKEFNGAAIKKTLEKGGINVATGNERSLAEEAPQAYKDIDEVVRVVDSLGISKKVARLKPLIVIKG